jgi:H+/gluconate symporter-like permease
MIVGMLPMSLGLGEGGEQNAPLGRAVIGGLLVATIFTLVFVPVTYAVLRRKTPAPELTDEELDEEPSDTAMETTAMHHSENGRLLVGATEPLTPGEGR